MIQELKAETKEGDPMFARSMDRHSSLLERRVSILEGRLEEALKELKRLAHLLGSGEREMVPPAVGGSPAHGLSAYDVSHG